MNLIHVVIHLISIDCDEFSKPIQSTIWSGFMPRLGFPLAAYRLWDSVIIVKHIAAAGD
jgi:hypothetical protein